MISFRALPVLAFVGLLLAAPPAAQAGDYADRSILGFSEDGGYFAFAQFGIEDGSGFPYALVHLIDTERGEPVGAAPINVRLEDDLATLPDARREALASATDLLARYGIEPSGRIVASNPSTELSADPYAVEFIADAYPHLFSPKWALTLTLQPFPGTSCLDLGTKQGFELALTNPAGETRILHRDDSVPDGRGCPLDYAIADVITFFPEGDASPVMVVLVHVITPGFEGPDRRFMAIPTRFVDN